MRIGNVHLLLVEFLSPRICFTGSRIVVKSPVKIDIRQFGFIPKENSDDMASDASNLSAIAKLIDFPVRSQCMSQEEYQEKSKIYYQQPGLRVLLGMVIQGVKF